MKFLKEYLIQIKKNLATAGRASRREYWMFVLFNFVVMLPVAAVIGANPELKFLRILLFPFFLANIGASCRRLHDTGRSSWWVLINFIPYAGLIAFIVFLCLDSQPGENKYGLNPKSA